MVLSGKAQDLVVAADALSGESTGGTAREAFAFLLGVDPDEVLDVLVLAVLAAQERDPSPDEPHLMGVLTGIEIGVAAERLRAGARS